MNNGENMNIKCIAILQVVCGLVYKNHATCLICLAIILGDSTEMVISCSTKFSQNFI